MTVNPSIDPARMLEEPLGKVGPGAQLGDGHVQSAGAGVEVAVSVAVALVDPARAGLAVLGTADRVGLGAHERVDERGQHLPQQIRTGLGQLLVQEVGRVDT